MRTCSIVLILIGILLVVLSPLWHRLASSRVFWDERAVQEYSISVADMHHANTEAAIDGKLTKQALAAQERYKTNQAKFNRARQFRKRGGKIMRWIGGIAAAIGIGLHQWSIQYDD